MSGTETPAPASSGTSARRIPEWIGPFLAAFAAGLVVHGAVAAWMPGFPDRDAWYHVRHAQLLAAGEAPWHGLSFPWMTHSAYADFPTDWSLGWHWLLAPFTLLGDLTTALRAGVVVQAAFLTGVAYTLLRRARVPWACLWTAVLTFGCAGWLFRLQMGRPTPLVLALLLLIVAAVVHRRTVATFALAALAMLVYHVPAPPLLAGGCAVLALAVGERCLPWRLALAGLAGLGVAILVHPGFWSVGDGGFFSSDHATFHLWGLMSESLEFADSGGAVEFADGRFLRVPLPLELAGAPWSVLATQFFVPLIATAWAVMAAWSNRRDPLSLATALFAGIGLVATHRSGRFQEYWVPMAVVAAALTFREREDVDPVERGPRWGMRAILAVLVVGALLQIPVLRRYVRESGDDGGRAVAPALTAISTSAEPGDVVWHGNWDEFAPLFHHAPHLRFLTGFDPWYFVAHDREDVWAHALCTVPDAWTDDELRQVLTERFGARYVLLWHQPAAPDRYRALEARLARLPWAERVHADAATTAFRVR